VPSAGRLRKGAFSLQHGAFNFYSVAWLQPRVEAASVEPARFPRDSDGADFAWVFLPSGQNCSRPDINFEQTIERIFSSVLQQNTAFASQPSSTQTNSIFLMPALTPVIAELK
jgi:hypothetical protein